MQVSAVNSVAFGGLFSNLRNKLSFRTALSLAEKAEKNLKSRIVNFEDLMIDTFSGLILESKSGTPFSGKFIVSGSGLERVYRIHEGLEKFSLVRFKNGIKYWAGKVSGRSKNFPSLLSLAAQKMEIREMRFADNAALMKMINLFRSINPTFA